MADTESTMLPLNTPAADFNLRDVVSEKNISLQQVKGKKGTLVMFICNHCPFVKHVNEELVKLASEYSSKDFGFVAINSNDAEKYPADSPEEMVRTAKKLNYPFPYLYDETQEVAKAYQAACTPDFFLFNSDLKLVYRGQLDSSRPGNDIPVTGSDIRNAMDNILSNKPQSGNQIPSIGCNIKWKEEN